MTQQIERPADFRDMVDYEKGTVDRRGFVDPDIYELELERIFARAWNFMAHDSQIPNPGDFFMTFIGEDRVIVVRDNDGNPQVLVNTCRHRGNAICRADEGHATSFMCTYHGWTYDLKGNLVGVPGFKEVYHEELDRENWGLIKAAQVDSYQGFIFANMDPEAVGLDEYLGETGKIGIGTIAARGDVAVAPGIQKYVMPCNWKLPTDNGVGDWYHPFISHASARMIPWQRPALPTPAAANNPFAVRHLVVLGEYGHTISGPRATPAMLEQDPWRESPKGKELLGPVGIKARGFPGIFPNVWIVNNQLSLRLPKGLGKCEIWFFTFVDQNLPKEQQQQVVFRSIHTFGPAGMLEQDDGENWNQAGKGMAGTIGRRFPLNHSLDHKLAEVINDETGPSHAETNVSEHAQLWLHRAWSEWMAAENWADLKANHSTMPTDVI